MAHSAPHSSRRRFVDLFRRRRAEPLPDLSFDLSFLRDTEPPEDYCGSTAEREEQVRRTEIARRKAAADSALLEELVRLNSASHDRRVRQVRDDGQLARSHDEHAAEEARRRYEAEHQSDLEALRRERERETEGRRADLADAAERHQASLDAKNAADEAEGRRKRAGAVRAQQEQDAAEDAAWREHDEQVRATRWCAEVAVAEHEAHVAAIRQTLEVHDLVADLPPSISSSAGGDREPTGTATGAEQESPRQGADAPEDEIVRSGHKLNDARAWYRAQREAGREPLAVDVNEWIGSSGYVKGRHLTEWDRELAEQQEPARGLRVAGR